MPHIYTFTIPIRVVSEANQREHWAVKLKRKKAQQLATMVAMRQAIALPLRFTTCVVTLRKLGGRRSDDDNLSGGFKHVRDQIARELKVDDGSDAVKWRYEQDASGKRTHQVMVEIAYEN